MSGITADIATHYGTTMREAAALAARFRGATAPNPTVGAAAVDCDGAILSIQAHERAGTGHAEAKVLLDCENRGLTARIHALVITLEPCNHHGRTPPCTEAILRAGVRRVVFGEADPNPKVAGGGGARLREAGLEVAQLSLPETAELIAPFAQWSVRRIPFVTIKTAHDPTGSMLPPPGTKTFTSEASLKLAHELRKRADALLTGSGTVLADRPQFTVRRVPDHPGKRRKLVILDRRGRVAREAADWLREREADGFEIRIETSYEEALRHLADQGVLEVLVEAGPEVTQAAIQSGLWNRHYRIEQVRDDHALIQDSLKILTN